MIDGERLVGYDRTRQIAHGNDPGEFAFVDYGEVPDMVQRHDREAVGHVCVRLYRDHGTRHDLLNPNRFRISTLQNYSPAVIFGRHNPGWLPVRNDQDG